MKMWGLEEGYYYKQLGLWLRLLFSGKLSHIRESLFYEMFRSCRLRKFFQLPIYSNFIRKIQKKISNTYMIYRWDSETRLFYVGAFFKISASISFSDVLLNKSLMSKYRYHQLNKLKILIPVKRCRYQFQPVIIMWKKNQCLAVPKMQNQNKRKMGICWYRKSKHLVF